MVSPSCNDRSEARAGKFIDASLRLSRLHFDILRGSSAPVLVVRTPERTEGAGLSCEPPCESGLITG
jgi:hypothetical protein